MKPILMKPTYLPILLSLCSASALSIADEASMQFSEDDIKTIVMAIDQNNDGIIDLEESQQWLFADLFYQSVIQAEEKSIATDDMIAQLVLANQEGKELIDPERYQEKVLAAYSDGFLDKTEIAYMSGENIFPVGSDYVDESLTVDALMTLDIDGDEQLTMQELLQEDLSAVVDGQISAESTGNTPTQQQRTEFVTKP